MADFIGTAGKDVLHGTADADTFHLEDGGDDRVGGRLGNDTFLMGGALTAADQINGGKGFDRVSLDGDYGAGLVLSATTLTSIEEIDLARGHDYALTLSNETLDALSPGLTVRGESLRAGDDMTIDASAIDHGAVEILAGGGDDILIAASVGTGFGLGRGGVDHATGGAGDDHFVFDRAFTDADRIDGGAGRDLVSFSGGDGLPIILGGDAIKDIEAVTLFSSNHFDLVATDALLDAGESLLLTAQKHSDFSFDGSQETDGSFDLRGSREADQMIGGALADSLSGDYGADTLQGGDGADHLSGGLGHDWFVYAALSDSTVGAADTIAFLEDGDIIDLSAIDANSRAAGDQKFHLVGAFSHHAGELVLSYDAGAGVTSLTADVDGDGSADMLVEIGDDHTDFTHFKL